MEEQAKIILYKQLVNFEVMSKLKKPKLISWEKYNMLVDKELLEYVFNYRDMCLNSLDKKIKQDKRKNFYLQLPDINLEGQDLSNLYLHNFMAGYSKERNNGRKVFVTTEVNLKNTNCVINMATIRPIIISLDGKTIKEISADITKCDFRGCTVFGKFQNSKAKLEYTEENLPKEYIERLLKFKVPDDAILTTDNIYIDMIENKPVRGTNGIEKVKQMVDYDLTELKDKIWKYRTVIRDYSIDISYTGAFFYTYGVESIGKENYYISLEVQAKEAYIKNNIDFVERIFKDLDKETRKNIVGLALKQGNHKFARKHAKELKGVQKKYLEARDSFGKREEEIKKVKDELLREYKDGKLIEFEIDLMKINVEIRSDIIEEIYRSGDINFVQKYLTSVSHKLKNYILINEYNKGNLKFLYKNFAQIDDGTLKQRIVSKELEAGNFKFLYANYDYIFDKEVKNKIIKNAYKSENIEFLNSHLDDMPKDMKLEAVIRFKNLKISNEEIAMLLKK